MSFDDLVETLTTYSAQQLGEVLVWREGFDRWRGVRDVPEFARYAPELLEVLLDRPEHAGERGSSDTADPYVETSSNQGSGRTISKSLLVGSTLVGLFAAVGIVWFQLEQQDGTSAPPREFAEAGPSPIPSTVSTSSTAATSPNAPMSPAQTVKLRSFRGSDMQPEAGASIALPSDVHPRNGYGAGTGGLAQSSQATPAASTPATAAPSAPAGICDLTGLSIRALSQHVPPEAFLNEITTKCKRGDLISFPSGHTYVMKKACDFGQQIVTTPKEIQCVYSGVLRSG